jgi:hypothetical protein
MSETNTISESGLKHSLLTFTINEPDVNKKLKAHLRQTATMSLMPLLMVYLVYCLLYIYSAMITGQLNMYFLARNVLAIFFIIISYFAAIKCTVVMEFMPAILFIYTALNNLVILYTDVMDESVAGYHAYVSLLNLNLYFTYYMLQMNCNYCIT